MPPDGHTVEFVEVPDTAANLPVDADLESLDAELAAAGAHARKVLYGRSQPTRVFANELRSHLLGMFEAPNSASGAGALAVTRAADWEIPPRPQVLISGETPPGGSRGTPAMEQANPVTLRAMLALLTLAGMAILLAVGALSGSFGPPLP